ncbi:MAG: C10 family peptidase [Candidatus Zixiibacteriota bacterium]
MNKVFGLIMLILISANLFAHVVDINRAEQVARNHIQLRSPENIVYRVKDRNIINNRYTGKKLFYVFRLEPDGYVAVSADRRTRPLLAWSFQNSCRITPPGNSMVQLVHDDMHNRYLVAEQNHPELLEYNNKLWNNYINMPSDFINQFLDLTEWGPFTKSEWNQSAPWDRYVPDDPITGERTPTGCVIVAVAQILNYWELPYSLPLDSTDSYYSETTDPSIWIDATTANMDTIGWNDSEDSPGPSDSTMAMLSWAIGVALGAEYADGGTVAHADAGSFYSLFGFARAEDFDRYMPGATNTIRDNMKNAKVAYMSFSGPDAGHAVVVDGYEETGSYHLNMGWGGYEDGWYYAFDEIPLYFTSITGMILNLTGNYHWDYPNNMASAIEIAPREHLERKINTINPVDDVDWFTFEASDDSTYYFYTTGMNDTYIEFYDAEGTLLEHVEDGGSEYNASKYWFTEPDSPGRYYVKVGADTAIADVNYKLWYKKISGPERQFVNITMPNGGETLIGGDRTGIIFTKGGDPFVNYVNIEYSVNGMEGPWHTIVDSLSSTYYMWEVPVVEDDIYDYWGCYLKIYDAAGGYAIDYTDEPFRMRHPDAIKENLLKPDEFLIGASPNPFNSSVRIRHRNLRDAQLSIYDIEGNKIVDQKLAEGTNSTIWNVNNDVSGGIYFAKVTGKYENEKIDQTIKLIYMK